MTQNSYCELRLKPRGVWGKKNEAVLAAPLPLRTAEAASAIHSLEAVQRA